MSSFTNPQAQHVASQVRGNALTPPKRPFPSQCNVRKNHDKSISKTEMDSKKLFNIVMDLCGAQGWSAKFAEAILFGIRFEYNNTRFVACAKKIISHSRFPEQVGLSGFLDMGRIACRA